MLFPPHFGHFAAGSYGFRSVIAYHLPGVVHHDPATPAAELAVPVIGVARYLLNARTVAVKASHLFGGISHGAPRSRMDPAMFIAVENCPAKLANPTPL